MSHSCSTSTLPCLAPGLLAPCFGTISYPSALRYLCLSGLWFRLTCTPISCLAPPFSPAAWAFWTSGPGPAVCGSGWVQRSEGTHRRTPVGLTEAHGLQLSRLALCAPSGTGLPSPQLAPALGTAWSSGRHLRAPGDAATQGTAPAGKPRAQWRQPLAPRTPHLGSSLERDTCPTPGQGVLRNRSETKEDHLVLQGHPCPTKDRPAPEGAQAKGEVGGLA